MFGLRNTRGSCWVNAALQGVFRIPDLQSRYSNDDADDKNPVETALQEIWSSKGDEGLTDFYECVKTKTMPAGENIGDSHELLEFLCDKVPFLDKLMRFKVGNSVRCNNPECSYKDTVSDTMTEFSIAPTKPGMSVSAAIVETVTPFVIDDWKCEKCSQKGCTKQLLLNTFPQVLTFHMTSLNTTVSYPAILVINKIKYALVSVVCFSGNHWFTYGRDLPPGKPWHKFDDARVQSFDGTSFPLLDTMRLLMYYRLNE